MVRKMKLPFLNKNNMTSSSSFSSSSSSSSSSWPWPSCHQQNPKTKSSRASVIVNKPKHVDESEPPPRSFSSSSSYSSYSSFSSTSHVMENPPEIESIENVIKGLKSSKRLIFEQRGTSNSILDDATKREDHEEEEEGVMLLSLETNDPYSDFKNSMEKMVEAHALHHDWKSLEKLLFWFLKVNAKTSHRYIFAAFVDLVLNFAVVPSKDVAGEPSSDVVVEDSLSSSWPISLYTSYSSSDETSSTSVGLLPETSKGEKKSRGVCCLSSLFELEEKINPND
ncbi:PREDICTED: transcription repressor OFP18 [Camelina sativa]|uniref:Transcription repressor n=1 Tax=Camelina sativa TaxID=90675 RepID=A0ABM0YPG5_CAMSA|nr:PREDICTED: transcription repressor OFP18 [Camelina sativa]